MSGLVRVLLAAAASLLGLALGQPTPAQQLFARMLQAEQSHAFTGELREAARWPEPLSGAADHFRHPSGVTPELVGHNLELAITGRDFVAGREAVVLSFLPRNGFSPNWTFWVDADSGLRLAYEQRDAEGALLAEGRYLRVDRVQPFDAPRHITAPQSSPVVKRNAQRTLLGDAFPPGVVPVALERTWLGDGAIQGLRLTLWDGLNGTVLLANPRQRQVPDRPYLASRSLRRVTVSALGPLPRAAHEGWLTAVVQGPVQRLDAQQSERFTLEHDRQPSDEQPRDERPHDEQRSDEKPTDERPTDERPRDDQR